MAKPKTEIKPIETLYRGCRFRSRLEARWAVFFDALKVTWDYEKEGYRLPSGSYLPDFWLSDLRCWVEIKPVVPTALEQALLSELVVHTRSDAFLFYGPVPGYDVSGDHCSDDDSGYAFSFCEREAGPAADWDHCYAFCECGTCGKIGIQFDGRSDRLPCTKCYDCNERHWGRPGMACSRPDGCGRRCPRSNHGDKGYAFNSNRILNAVTAARSARFEHGQQHPRV